MQALLNHFIEQSLTYALLAVALVAFLESLVIVGLMLPGALMMAAIGALIGSGRLNLYQAWTVAIIGCLLADWLSFWIGWQFKGVLHRSKLVNKYRIWLDKTEHALHRHNMLTILIGRFIGPTRPIVPMVAGMLNLSVVKFLIPSFIGSLLWPPVYFMPGILAGVALDIPTNGHGGGFKWLLLALALLIWLAIWLCWRSWRFPTSQQTDKPSHPSLTHNQWRLLATLTSACTLIIFFFTWHHPLMPAYLHLFGNVLRGI